MTASEILLGEPAIQAIGWALLHFVWQGALIAVVAAIALRALRGSAADIRYVVATIALAIMATLPIVTGVQTWRSLRAQSVGHSSPALPLATSSLLPSFESDPLPSGLRTPSIEGPSVPPPLERWLPVFVLTWMGGVAILALRLIGGWIWIQRVRSRGASAADRALQLGVERLARRLHIGRPVTLLQAPVTVPTVIGWLRPTILVPLAALGGLSPAQVEAILAHELAHIRRHDYLVNLLQSLLETLLFYHPAVWWLSREIRLERENCCDDLAVSLCGDPVVYARALADLEELRGAGADLAMAASGGVLLARVRRLLAAPAPHAGRGPAWLAASTAVVLMLGIVGSAVGGPDTVIPQSAVPVEAKPDTLLPATGNATVSAQTPGFDDLRQYPLPPAPPAPPVPPAPLPPSADSPGVPPLPAPASPARAARPAPLPPPPGTMLAPPAALPASPVPPAPPAPPAPSGGFELSSGGRQESSGTVSWSNNGEKIEVKFHGSFELSNDDADIVKMSPGAYVRVSDGAWLRSRSVEFSADEKGNITRRFFVGSSERPFEPEGRQWLSRTLPRFVRVSGFAAKPRVARILRSGGVPALLSEISKIEGSHGKKTYFVELIAAAPLDGATARQVLEQAGREITSDYELATLLIHGAATLIVDDATRRAYFDAARTIDSDYEMRRVFSAALERGAVSPALLVSVLEAVPSISSSYESASLLVQIVRQHGIEGQVRSPFFKALEEVSSSYEKGRVLQAVVRRTDLSSDTLVAALTATGTLDSNHEASQVLQLAARSHSITGAARDAYLKAADRLADHEQNQALAALVKNEKKR